MSGKSSDQYQICWMPRECFSTPLPKCTFFLSCSHIQGMAINWSCGVPLNALYTLLSPTSMDEMIIMLTIKYKSCSWRNFHPDAQCVTLNFYYNKKFLFILVLICIYAEDTFVQPNQEILQKCSTRFTKHFWK